MNRTDSTTGGGSASSSTQAAQLFETVARDVRRPIEAMMAVTELLQRQPLTPDALAYVKTLSEHQQGLVRALLDAADLLKAEAGQLEIRPEPVELRVLMDSIQDEWASIANTGGVALSISYDGADIAAVIDARRLRQVFCQLIKRALGATRRGGVEASLQARREDGRIVLCGRVRDSGAVLSEAKLSALFEGGDTTDGVNLRLCRRLMEAMNGKIAAENNAGAGSTLIFEMSADEAEAADEGFTDDTTTARGAHILVVDDNATNRMVAEALCEMFDCTSESAEDGVEAVAAAESGRFDLILMDIKMPRMDGVEATRLIRAMDGVAGKVPIIALTANADPEDAMNYLASGMSSVVEKPIKPEALLAAMNACLPEAPEGGSGHAAAA